MLKKIKSSKGTIVQELDKHEFRVTIFGSARIHKNDRLYRQIFSLAKEIGKCGIDIITGGGPGAMEAANAGHNAGDKHNNADSIGLVIKLPWENAGNQYLEMQKQFERFSARLDHFMALSTAVVIMPGGIGTCLELFYAWQLIQVKHVRPIPIILFGEMWEELYQWLKKYPLESQLISRKDMDYLHIAKNNQEVLKIIFNHHRYFNEEGENYYKIIKKYTIKS